MPKQKTIPFGISFRGQREYTLSEVSNFIECADGVEPVALQSQYISFLEDFTSRKIKPSTLVDVDVLTEFKNDCANRYEIDFWDDENRKEYGNKALYFKKLSDHINKILK